MMCVVNFFVFALSQLQGGSGEGLVGRNPKMSTPRHRNGGGDSVFFKFSFTCIDIPLYT